MELFSFNNNNLGTFAHFDLVLVLFCFPFAVVSILFFSYVYNSRNKDRIVFDLEVDLAGGGGVWMQIVL